MVRFSVIWSYAVSFGVMMIERVVMVTVHGMRPETVILFAETMVLSELTVAGCGFCGLAVLCCWWRCCGVRELDAVTDPTDAIVFVVVLAAAFVFAASAAAFAAKRAVTPLVANP